MICGHTSDEPRNSKVPLSCVPPIRLFCGCLGSTDRLWNWSVESPLFMLLVFSGIRESIDLQNAVSAAFSPRLSHWADASTYWPFARTTPPSSPAIHCSGSPGIVTRPCWSGWSQPRLSLSSVMSVKVDPPSIDCSTARPLDKPCSCPYEYEP